MDPVHFSTLKRIAQSPMHYRYALAHPPSDTPSFRFGRLVHGLVLGGHEPLVYDGDRRGKAWADFKAAHEGADIVTADEMARARAAADAVLSHREAARLLDGCETEVAIDWQIGERACAGRVDALHPSRVVELKTASTADPERLMRAARHYGYHAQLSWYAHGAGLVAPEAYIIAVESAAPHAVSVLRLTPRTLDEGARIWRLWIERLLACEAADEWPGYAQTVLDWDTDGADDDLIFDEEAAA